MLIEIQYNKINKKLEENEWKEWRLTLMSIIS